MTVKMKTGFLFLSKGKAAIQYAAKKNSTEDLKECRVWNRIGECNHHATTAMQRNVERMMLRKGSVCVATTQCCRITSEQMTD